MASFQDRVVGALQAKASTFAEVRQDPSALSQAGIVVVASAVSRGLPALVVLGLVTGPMALVGTVVVTIISWVAGCAVLWIVGTKVITGTNTTADLPQTLRTMGFAYAPMLVGIVAIVPFIGPLIVLLVFLYSIYVALVATKELFGYPDLVKAFVALLICAVVVGFAFFLLALAGAGAWFVMR